MKRALAAAALVSLIAVPLLAWSAPSQAQDGRCLSPEYLIAMARDQRPGTIVFARHTGSDAAALVEAMNRLDAEEDEMPAADEITVLRSAQSDEVLLLAAEDGCLIWRGQMSKPDYEHAAWKAFGLPI